MTTQIPYDPGSAQPMPAYPTAPPWAPPAPAAEAPAGPPWAGTPHTQHGQLMVPYPELMHGASRPAPPSWVPVAVSSLVLSVLGVVVATTVCTVFFGLVGGSLLGAAGGALGLLGAVPAARRASRAKRQRNARYPYWLAFGLALVAATVPGIAAIGGTARVVQSQLVEPAAVKAVQSDMVHGNKIKTAAGVTVRSAKCTAVAPRRTDGLREYSCVVTLSSGDSGTLHVLADRKGGWTAVKSG
jgi:hypothetical protein